MKLSLKHSSIFTAVAMSIYCLFIIFAQTELYKNVILPIDRHFALSYICTSLLLISILVLGVALFSNRNNIPKLSKPLIWQSRIITAVLCFVLFCNIFSIASVCINGMLYFWWLGFEWLHYVMLFLITAWLWQFAFIKHKEYIPAKCLGNCGLVVSIGIGAILLLMLISFVYVLFTGHVAGFRTNILVSWLKPISALLLFGIYVFTHRRSSSISSKSHSGT